MSNRDIGIRALIPGQRSPDEIQEDENNRRYVETVVNQRARVIPEVKTRWETLGETLVATTPSLNLEVKPKVEPKGTPMNIDKVLIDQAKGAELVRKHRQDPKWVEEHNKRFPRFKTTVLPKEDPNKKTVQQLRTLRSWGLPTPVGLGDKYKSDPRTPVQKKRDAFAEKQKWINDDKKLKAFAKAEDPTKGAHYIPWEQRMAQEEAESLNQIKRTTWEQGGRVKPEPKYVTAQDVINVYKPKEPEASPLQMKKLHQRLENHNQNTGEFKNLPKEEELHPYEKGMEEDLQKIEDKGKSWFSKHLKKPMPIVEYVNKINKLYEI